MAAPSKGLNVASMRRVRSLWQESVQRLTLAELRALGTNRLRPRASEAFDNQFEGEALVAARRTHWELKVRIAHRLKDFLFLPYQVMANPSVRSLYEKYVSAYILHEEFSDRLTCEKAAGEYWVALATTFNDHQHVTRLLGHSRKQLIRLDPGLAPTLDAFFDRFFVSRIGTHLLGASFLHLGSMRHGAQKQPAGVAMGVLQPTSPAGFVRDLAATLRASCGQGMFPPVLVEDPADTSILYIPGHLRVILREILNNAIVATMLTAKARGCDPEPVRIRVHRGQFGVFVTVSDRGGGFSQGERLWSWGEDLPSGLAPVPGADGSDEELDWFYADVEAKEARPAMLPLGFGLPLARLTARYFGGDVRLQTLLGFGTNAYVHIPELQEEGAHVGEDRNGGSGFS